MNRSCLVAPALMIAAAACGITGIAAGQTKESPQSGREETNAGFWPTSRMMDAFLERGADDVADRYKLNDEQREFLLSDMRKRWPAFMEKHRKVIQPIMNEVIEMRMAGETPSAEKAAAWATQVIPILEEAKKNINEGSAEFGKILNAEQKERLSSELMQFNLGYTFISTRAKAWKEGKFTGSDWPQDRGWRGRGRGRGRDDTARRMAAASAPAVIEAPKSVWRKYVEKFAADNQLDESQRRAADGILKEMEERAAPLLRDYDAVLAILKSGDEATRERSNQRREQLDADLNKRFAELRQRLDALLTSAQRARISTPSGASGR